MGYEKQACKHCKIVTIRIVSCNWCMAYVRHVRMLHYVTRCIKCSSKVWRCYEIVELQSRALPEVQNSVLNTRELLIIHIFVTLQCLMNSIHGIEGQSIGLVLGRTESQVLGLELFESLSLKGETKSLC